ncbi:S-adenosylmethionine:tRNA ribosyltransferase-isomerase [alpha proteobacterium IMCC14465]|uniref:S-adenosylmethionine:tRNA ribosyltransferase-isomerase n=1 Tax=alpha proteobacterium IMCC14465 TaxID=1220535 RepID=J9DHZ7_9PROT|nr:S-adenosylmethionine:tRNA ribosyltransferase-isomerase [alpha proteobacterium IMCC14465]
MQVEAFDFNLPEELIALRPASPRDSAKLLHVASDGNLSDKIIRDLPSYFSKGEVLVVNDTRVIPAKLTGTRLRDSASNSASETEQNSGAQIDLNLIERQGASMWKCLLKPAKKVRSGDVISFADAEGGSYIATVREKEQGEALIDFNLSLEKMDEVLGLIGSMPLPPYIAGRRTPDEKDNQDYQTLFAEHDGAVAAPTAGLHFTPELQAKLENIGVEICRVTLHVGAGTFLPIKVEDTNHHKMHAEWGEVKPETADRLNAAKQNGFKICCVGTTSLRLLESAARDDGLIAPFAAPTDIFIKPGYQFKAADRLLTNFHLPKSTLFMLVSAFSGLATMKKAYDHAVHSRYRFYSYGDACLLELTEKMD